MAMAAVAIVSFSATAQVKKGKTRLALTKQIMGGLVQPNCGALGKGTQEAPADGKAWAALATNAALLNEAKQRGKTVMVVHHDLDTVQRVALVRVIADVAAVGNFLPVMPRHVGIVFQNQTG